MAHSNSLEEVTNEFRQWRKTRTSPRTTTPISLRQQAVALLADYSPRAITVALGTNHKTLKRWQRECNQQTESPLLMEQSFVPLHEALNITEQDTELHVTLENDQGSRLTLKGVLSPQQLAALANSLSSPGGVIE